MKQLRKKFSAFVCAVAVLITAFGSHITIYAENETGTTKTEQALEWILGSANENGSFGDDSLINDTAEVQKLLGDFGVDYESEWLIENAAKWSNNNDSLARLYLATGNEEYLEPVLATQNPDGGFGLNRDYTSDVLDSVLVYEALVRRYIQTGENLKELQLLAAYLMEQQNDDGSYSYTQGAGADYELTARIAIITTYLINMDVMCDEAWLAGMEEYLMKEKVSFEGDFVNAAYQRIYMCMSGMITDTGEMEAELKSLQQEDGSFMGSLDSTMAAVRLMLAIGELNKPYLKLCEMNTELSSYVLYEGFEKTITVQSDITYKTNSKHAGRWILEVTRDGELLQQEEVQVDFDENSTEEKIEKTITLQGVMGNEYCMTTRLEAEGEELHSDESRIKVMAPSVENLLLSRENPGGESVSLSWNDISCDFSGYGYRLYRKTEGGEWETKSVWNRDEKVKVLNIYPCPVAENYLKDWMSTSIEGGEPAGRGLFEIETVEITDYNADPEKYLKNADGTYRHDVLFFGTYDSNAYRDLNSVSYEATMEFIESGRGVLFGHDTVVPAWPYFLKFTDMLGIKVKAGSPFYFGKQVKVVNEGALTSYPWKLTGTLDIPSSHINCQYAGGTLPSTVWMEFVEDVAPDEETGASLIAYLFSHNQLAMIQTGHSSGQATDDERKIIANTLFYLKQLTDGTGTVDNTAYDLASPQITGSGAPVSEGAMVSLFVEAADKGTKYTYYVEGMPKGDIGDEWTRKSNELEITAVSGIKGYAVIINDSKDAGTDMISTEVIVPENGVITAEIPEPEEGKTYYMHIRAVDNAGNMSEEAVLEVSEKQAEISEEPEGEDCFGTGYSLFGSEDITIYCSELTADGNTYSGGSFTFGGSALNLSGGLEAAGSINAWAGSVNAAERLEQAEEKEMPALHDSIMAVMGGAEVMEVLDAYSSTQVDVPTYCMTTTGAWCPELILKESLACEGTINAGAGCVVLGQEKDTVLYSVNGDISINSSTLTGRGLIYAPNGTVTINVQNLDFAGSIIAKRIVIQGSVINID